MESLYHARVSGYGWTDGLGSGMSVVWPFVCHSTVAETCLIDEGIDYIARACKLIRFYVYGEYIRSTCGSGV